MRSLLKLSIVVGILVGFAAAAAALSILPPSSVKVTLVSGVVVPPPRQPTEEPARLTVALYEGRPHRITDADVPVDDVELEEADRRFVLDASPDDGSRFFVVAMAERPSYDRLCTSRALQPVRMLERDGERTWVSADTNRPLPPLRLAPAGRC